MKEQFRERLHQRKKALGLTWAEIAERGHMSRRTLDKFTIGQSLPGYESVIALCKGLDCDPNFLTGFTDPGDDTEYTAVALSLVREHLRECRASGREVDSRLAAIESILTLDLGRRTP